MNKKTMTVLTGLVIALCLGGCNAARGGAESMAEPPEGAQSEPLDAEAEQAANVSVDDILMAIESAYGESYPLNGPIPPEVLESEFGLAPELCEDAKGEMAMISVQNDRVVVVKAAAGKADAVEKALLDARQRKIDDTLQYPMNIPKTNAAKVVRHGDFVAFLLVGVPDDSIEDVESAQAAAYAESQVQIAVDAFEGVFAI